MSRRYFHCTFSAAFSSLRTAEFGSGDIFNRYYPSHTRHRSVSFQCRCTNRYILFSMATEEDQNTEPISREEPPPPAGCASRKDFDELKLRDTLYHEKLPQYSPNPTEFQLPKALYDTLPDSLKSTADSNANKGEQFCWSLSEYHSGGAFKESEMTALLACSSSLRKGLHGLQGLVERKC